MSELIVAPILLPMLAAVLMLAAQHRRRWHLAINLVATTGGLVLALALLHAVKGNGAPGAVAVYLPGNWNVPFGIVLAADRLSALMLVLTAVVALAALVFAVARWDRAGVYFHPLFQLQLMGLNGVFLTADLFNLFVFFEVMLSASYGLLLHGSGRWRVRAGLHYLVINLAASSLFLIGVSMLYGVTGTLNMADMAQRILAVPAEDRGLLHAGAAILAIAFLTKAAMWPLNFWLVPAYTAASAPVHQLLACCCQASSALVPSIQGDMNGRASGGAASPEPAGSVPPPRMRNNSCWPASRSVSHFEGSGVGAVMVPPQCSFTCGSVRRTIRRASVSRATLAKPCSANSCIL